MTDQDPRVPLAAMQARAKNATEGPWKVRVDFPLGGGRVYEPSGFPLPGCFNCGENDAVYEDVDAEFIGHARTDLPKLAAALEGVLDLHAPDGTFPDFCSSCDDYNPCETVRAITEHLEADHD